MRGDIPYFHDFNVTLSKKINKKLKVNAMYLNLFYNRSVLEDGLGDESILLNPDGQKLMSGDIFILESLYKVKRKHYLRTEFQHLSTKDDRGSMAMALAEYSLPRTGSSVYKTFTTTVTRTRHRNCTIRWLL